MSAIRSLFLAIEMATRKRDQATQDLMRVQNAHLFAQSQMTQLETYADETEARWTVAAQISTSPELMRHHYQFMDRLHHAVGLQKGVLESESRKVDHAKRLVLDAEFRLVSLKQVLKKKQADISILQSRREQKQMDEFATLRSGQLTDGYFSGERP
ncbi:flagellar export protein FliJ [Rhodoferax ferrireducens]|uniref:flagellar export protein FliJ n=1 Tax=Rhodoferax ferrireducens TaxID=192843 RepID=UPI000E0D00CF|nr:flagellar export protein FliJ [Rhodoferax ferrireducens]